MGMWCPGAAWSNRDVSLGLREVVWGQLLALGGRRRTGEVAGMRHPRAMGQGGDG